MGKRIRHTCRRRGRVRVRTGRNSADRDTGGQWYLQTYVVAHGPPPLPLCCRGRLDAPDAPLPIPASSRRVVVRAKRGIPKWWLQFFLVTSYFLESFIWAPSCRATIALVSKRDHRARLGFRHCTDEDVDKDQAQSNARSVA